MKLKFIVTVSTVVLGLLLLTNCSNKDWRTASRESAGMAPKPEEFKEAIVQIYGARTFGWRGWFAIHPWIAVKGKDESSYKIYDVVGWRARRGQEVMQVYSDLPDRYWFGAKPQLLKEFRGEGVDDLIDKIHDAAFRYPWRTTYKAFPGPNSNTFLAWVVQEVPELDLTLPRTAIGKGYLKYQ